MFEVCESTLKWRGGLEPSPSVREDLETRVRAWMCNLALAQVALQLPEVLPATASAVRPCLGYLPKESPLMPGDPPSWGSLHPGPGPFTSTQANLKQQPCCRASGAWGALAGLPPLLPRWKSQQHFSIR